MGKATGSTSPSSESSGNNSHECREFWVDLPAKQDDSLSYAHGFDPRPYFKTRYEQDTLRILPHLTRPRPFDWTFKGATHLTMPRRRFFLAPQGGGGVWRLMLRLRFNISPSARANSGARTELRGRLARRTSTPPKNFSITWTRRRKTKRGARVGKQTPIKGRQGLQRTSQLPWKLREPYSPLVATPPLSSPRFHSPLRKLPLLSSALRHSSIRQATLMPPPRVWKHRQLWGAAGHLQGLANCGLLGSRRGVCRGGTAGWCRVSVVECGNGAYSTG